jgi:adenosylcobinamide-GDP ribazoletransferase
MASAATVRPSPRPLADLAAAVGFLTLLPVGRVWSDEALPRPVGWYPWVGWLLGALGALPVMVLTRLGVVPAGNGALLTAVVVVLIWALMTRLLHWDGLADTFDGIWGGSTTAEALEIMRDSRTGAFGFTAIALVALAQVTAVAMLIEHGSWWVLFAAPVIARAAASVAAWRIPAARADGLGRSVAGSPGVYDLSVAAASLLALAAFPLLGVAIARSAAVYGAGLFAALAIPSVLGRPVRGMTGDLLGATVLIVETCVLIAGAVI